jgi:hypothetical protein
MTSTRAGDGVPRCLVIKLALRLRAVSTLREPSPVVVGVSWHRMVDLSASERVSRSGWWLVSALARRAPGRGLPRPEAGRWRRARRRAAPPLLIQYGSTRQRGAIGAFLCCVLAALGSAAADLSLRFVCVASENQ